MVFDSLPLVSHVHHIDDLMADSASSAKFLKSIWVSSVSPSTSIDRSSDFTGEDTAGMLSLIECNVLSMLSLIDFS